MSLEWIAEPAARWDEDKARIVGGVEPGIFDVRYGRLAAGDPVPGDWFRVEDDGAVVGYGWMDQVWGDAEISLAVDPAARGKGVGTEILERLEAVARGRGINYVYNTVRPTHPHREGLSHWLSERGFKANEDGSLFRASSKA